MQDTHGESFCTFEETPARTRLFVRHVPALLPGPLTSGRERSRALRHLAREVAIRLNEARAPRRERLCSAVSAMWAPLALPQE